MGGLHLSDFSDPETGFADDMRAVVEANDFKSDDVASIVDSGDYGEAQDHKLSHDHHANSSEEEHDYLENENQMKLTISATDISSTELASELEVSEHFRTPSASRIAAPAERTPSSLSTEYDSPLPIARAGPVIIPHIGSHYLSSQTIRADPGSPFRSLPFNSSPIGQIESMGAFTPDVTIRLGRIDSPESPKKPASQMPLTIQQTPLISSMHKALLPADATPPAARHPVSYTRPGVIETNSKTLKSSVGQATTIIPVPSDCMKSAARPGKVVARALAVRVQLDAAFQSKLGSMGPPQRAVSSSSVSSSASSSSISQQNSVARNGMTAPSKASQYASNKMDSSKLAKLNAGPTNPIGNPRTPATLPQNLVRGSNRPPTNCGRFTSQPKVRTSVASIACQHKSAVPLLSTKAASRPALAPRAIPQCVVRTTEAHTNASKMARPPLEPNASIPNIEAYNPLACSPQAVQLNTLKRPLPISQPTMGRPLVTASGKPVMRPTLGLPSRLGREGTATRLMPVFSLGAAGGNESGTPGRSGIKSPHRPILARPATNNSWGTPSDLRLTKVSDFSL